MDAGFKSELIAWGVDWDDVLGRFIMFKFLNDKNMGELTKYLEEGNVTEAFKAVHALKGVSANLGLKGMLGAVCELTEILRAGSMEGYEEQYDKIKPKYDELVTILNKFKDTAI